MSFFQKMMRINKSKNQQNTNFDEGLERNSGVFNLEEETEQCQMHDLKQQLCEVGLRKSIADEELPEVPEQPKAQLVYPSSKPLLLTYLLPKKQQLLREMLARKRQFEIKKLTNSKMKGIQLKKKLEQSSIKILNTENSNPKMRIVESNVRIVQSMKQSNFYAIRPIISQKKIEKKPYKQSESQQNFNLNPNLNMEKPPQNPFQRQIMMRLINLLENQRHDRKDMMAMSMNINNQLNNPFHHQKQKDMPIIINNILKTPIDSLSKDIMEREMKIKILQNNRSKQKNSYYYPHQEYTENKTQNPMTQRSQYTKCNQFNPHRRNSKAKISLQCSRVSAQSKREKEQIIIRKSQPQSTKPSSNFSSQIVQNSQDSKTIKSRERTFNRLKNDQKKQKLIPQQNIQIKPTLLSNQCHSSEAMLPKASIRLDIPFKQGSENQNLSLAEAFKKKIGRLKTQKQKQKLQQKNKLQKLQINDQNAMTQLYAEFKTPKEISILLMPLESTQIINISKQSANSKKTQKAIKKSSFPTARGRQNTTSKNSRQPSKELIDRLIGGERAKISKKQMYALTRKNYENLPQIQAKKKEQQKRQQERQRLAKIRELQRSTRTLKQVKMSLQ